jgi:eukaryotic translation initiation factor 2C
MIDKLDEIMLERLTDFKQHNQGKLPANIIFYRDGVSEGQFDQVIGIELPQIKEAFKQLGNAKAPYNPKLTIIICGTRWFIV